MQKRRSGLRFDNAERLVADSVSFGTHRRADLSPVPWVGHLTGRRDSSDAFSEPDEASAGGVPGLCITGVSATSCLGAFFGIGAIRVVPHGSL